MICLSNGQAPTPTETPTTPGAAPTGSAPTTAAPGTTAGANPGTTITLPNGGVIVIPR